MSYAKKPSKHFQIVESCNVDFYIEVQENVKRYCSSLLTINPFYKSLIRELTFIWIQKLKEIYNPHQSNSLLAVGFRDSCIEQQLEKEGDGFISWHLKCDEKGQIIEIWFETENETNRCNAFGYRKRYDAEDNFIYCIPISEIRMLKIKSSL